MHWEARGSIGVGATRKSPQGSEGWEKRASDKEEPTGKRGQKRHGSDKKEPTGKRGVGEAQKRQGRAHSEATNGRFVRTTRKSPHES